MLGLDKFRVPSSPTKDTRSTYRIKQAYDSNGNATYTAYYKPYNGWFWLRVVVLDSWGDKVSSWDYEKYARSACENHAVKMSNYKKSATYINLGKLP